MIILVIAAIIAVIAVYLNGTASNSAFVAYDNVAVSQSTLNQLRTIADNNTLASQVGAGVASTTGLKVYNKPALTANGKPVVLYVGADYCPFCASTRWGLVIALMRFGNFTELHYMTSSATDSYSGTPTFTFYNSNYQSSLINFTEAEFSTNKLNGSSYPALQNITPFENSLINRYNPGGSIPFIDFGNYSVQVGALTSPQVIQYLNWSTVVNRASSNTDVAQAVIGTANIFTAEICKELNNSAPVCSQAYVVNLEKTYL